MAVVGAMNDMPNSDFNGARQQAEAVAMECCDMFGYDQNRIGDILRSESSATQQQKYDNVDYGDQLTFNGVANNNDHFEIETFDLHDALCNSREYEFCYENE